MLASYRLQISLKVRQLSLKNKNISERYRVITFRDSSDGIVTKLWDGISKNVASFPGTERDLISAPHPGRALGLSTGPRTRLTPEPKARMCEPIPSLPYTSQLRDASTITHKVFQDTAAHQQGSRKFLINYTVSKDMKHVHVGRQSVN